MKANLGFRRFLERDWIGLKPTSIGQAVIVYDEFKETFRWYKNVLSGYKKTGHQRRLQKAGGSQFPGKYSAKSPVTSDLKIPILNEKNRIHHQTADEKNINGDCYTIVSNPETNKSS